jgi:hypothetical protein
MVDNLVVWRAKTDGVVWRTVGGEVIVMHLSPGRYYSLRGVGGAVWQLLAAAPQTSEDLVGTLAEQYDVERSTLAADVERFLRQLEAAELVAPIVP